ncbi:Protein of unknown function DUF3602 [Penicillium coprophilum]|uniref:Protein of unknown function DUF3602 n=1 Tax=Penicillium coprophilum TaxID=36646 RepID=UPI00239E17CE|nr:Protein of unknown function DUF3602 [Penicillium coprophilum]KAJ5154212.1 Protein of unknown function DUF3602 [Penicillium coprophilum]
MPEKPNKPAKTEPEAPMVSHGRGGQGNIGHDPTEYVDGEIVREGPYGDQGDGAYSAGVSTSPSIKPCLAPTDAFNPTQRGGAGNIGSPMVRPMSRAPHDADMIPELAVRDSVDETYHTGRGGQGNVHLDAASLKEKKVKKVAHEGLADKLKYKLMGRK